MELHKLASSLEEKLSKYNVKVFVGGSYALRHVYKLLDRDINDIDMIISYRSTENVTKEVMGEAILEALGGLFPLDTLESACDHYESSNWIVNHKVRTIVGYAATEVNFLCSADKHYRDYNSKVAHEGVKVVELGTLLEAKGSYYRLKDIVDFFEMSKKLTGYCKDPDNLPF
jgi:hypothetical protein